MTDKYITEYTEETSPNTTDAVLIDQGSGAYKYATVAKIRAVSTPMVATTGTFSGAVSGITTLGCGAITSSGAFSATSGTFNSGTGNTPLTLTSTDADCNLIMQDGTTTQGNTLVRTGNDLSILPGGGSATFAGAVSVGGDVSVTGDSKVSGAVYKSTSSGTLSSASNVTLLAIADMEVGEIYQVNVVSNSGATWHIFGFASLRTAGDVEAYNISTGGTGWTIVTSSAVGIEIASGDATGYGYKSSILRVR